MAQPGDTRWDAGAVSDAPDPTILRDCRAGDEAALWQLLRPVYRAGETYAVARDIDEREAVKAWRAHQRVRVAELTTADGSRLVGSYYLGPNLPGPGSHVANAGFVVSDTARGMGLGRRMAEESLTLARELGFTAMQFNFVVSTNPAVRLWTSLGFDVVGRIPGAYDHAVHGPVDALVMHRLLT